MSTAVLQPTIQYAKPVHPKASVSFRKNVLPPILGVLITVGLFGLFNSQWIIAQGQYRFSQHNQSVSSVIPSTAPANDSVTLSIPKIQVNAPVVYDETSLNEHNVQLALRRGPVHYGTTAFPGEVGNSVIVGHSSGQPWAPGNYKFVFTLLDKLSVNDKIFVDYKGTRYIYKVTSTKVIEPTDLNVLKQSKDPQLTLITCTPVGTSKHRLVVSAKQVYPNPATATKTTQSHTTLNGLTLPQ